MGKIVRRYSSIEEIPPLTEEQKQELAQRADEDIDLSDIPELTEEFWAKAEVGKFYRPRKQQITVKLDADIVAWLKSGGKGYQTRLNEFLRRAMLNNSTTQKNN